MLNGLPRRLFIGVTALLLTSHACAVGILFIGNSFTYGYGSPVRFWHANSVTDLNAQGIGGVPALFKAFTMQAGLSYDVFLETQPDVGLDWHLEHRRDLILQRGWDVVVMHGLSVLDRARPGDPTTLVTSARQMAELLRARNAAVDVRLTQTWPRADQIYDSRGAWFGKPIEVMDQDLRSAYNQAAVAIAGKKQVVIPVGDAWLRAMRAGVADSNPYDGIDANKLDLWAYDHYHASTYGYYLEALMVFSSVTGRDPRSLGLNECSGFELGLSQLQIGALQQVAYDQLASEALLTAAAPVLPANSLPARCYPNVTVR